jgi:PAS domain S-box-containing protein
MESIHRRKNGEVYPVEIYSNYVRFDSKEYKLAFVHDITERKKADDMLRQYAHMASSSTDMMALLNKRYVYLAVNDAYSKTFNKTRDDLIGRTVAEVFGEESFNSVIKPNADRCLAEEKVNYQDWFNFPALGKRYMDINYYPHLNNSNEIVGFVVNARDITKNKQAEEEKERLLRSVQQIQKMESIGTLAGGIAHDFNNILTSIIGYSEFNLAKFPKESKTFADFKQILDSGLRARDLVKQILTFSLQGEHTLSAISLVPIMREALKFMRSSLPTNIEIRQNFDDESGTIKGDITQIHQIIMNLCVNAEHAMRPKGGVLEVNLEYVHLDSSFCAIHFRLNKGDYFKLKVSDTGHGMSKEIMDRIFDPFFTTKGVGEGTGMGLSTVHGIVLNHGGDIIVDSELGKGTTFNIYFPKSGDIEIAEKTESLTIPRGSERILFVDDEESVAKFGQDMLWDLGYKVLTKTNSLEALEIFKKDPHKFDLVITDQTMPIMTGEVLAKKLMQIRPEIPVILCTGFSHTITAKEALSMGIREFIMKPFINHDIAQLVRKVLDQDKKKQGE